MTNLKSLTDDALILRTEMAVSREREALTDVLKHLKEIDRRRLYSRFQCKSIHEFAMKIHGYTEDQAQMRVTAMYLIADLPEVEEKLESGSLSLSHLNLAQSFFRQESVKAQITTPEAKLELIEKIENTSKREAAKILFHETGTKIEPKERVRELGDGKIEFALIGDESLRAKLQRLQGLLKHTDPNLTLSQLLAKLADLGLEKWDPLEKAKRAQMRDLKKAAASKEPTGHNSNGERVSALERNGMKVIDRTKTVSAKNENTEMRKEVFEDQTLKTELSIKARQEFERKTVSRSVPARSQIRKTRYMKRVPLKAKSIHRVWLKANGDCAICRSTKALEIDHVIPVALGGTNEEGNLRLLCRSCNQRQGIEKLKRSTQFQFLR